jgi:hypothetical protein
MSERASQEELVRSYDLSSEIVGSDADARLRILPRGYERGAVEQCLGEEWSSDGGWLTASNP